MMNQEETIMEKCVGNQLVRIREELGMTSHQVSLRLSIPIEQLEDYEQGSMSVPAFLLGKPSMFYRVNPEYFFETVPVS